MRSAVLRPHQRAAAPSRRVATCSAVARHLPHSSRRAAAPLSPLAPRRSLSCRAATLDAAATAAPPSSVDWRSQWYGVAFVADLDPLAPVPFQLLGENMCVVMRRGELMHGPDALCLQRHLARRGWHVARLRRPLPAPPGAAV